MINLKAKDSVADAVKDILQQEALKGQQHQIDKNKNKKIDAQDFAILRGEKKPEVKKEEVEQIDELKKSTVKSYLSKKMASLPGKNPKKDQESMMKAHHRVTGVKPTSEEVELDEGTMTHITLGKKVKNDEGGHNQDVHYKGKKIGSIDSYKHRTGLRYGGKHDATGDMDAGSRSPEEAVDFVRSSHAEHLKSMKEDTELNEREMTAGETAEKERIVKGMKKSLSGFKARYGEKAKNVMYATATKQAMKEEERVDEANSPFDWKKPREPEVKGGAGFKPGRAYGGAAQKSKPEQEDEKAEKKK